MDSQVLHEKLKTHFGYSSFRPMQEDIIRTVLNKKDCVVLMPTGGGKSICFQLPAMLLPGLAIVVSPLISLMKDQVEALRTNGIQAAFLNSSQSSTEQVAVELQAKQGQISLLYVSPEKLLTRYFYEFMQSVQLSLIAIDEAHCISSWGHDFRPEYTKLWFLKAHFPTVPVIALTATADKITRRDIVEQLKLPEPACFVSTFDRPNLSLHVKPGRQKYQQIERFLKQRDGHPGIIYCLSRKNCEDVAGKLLNDGYRASYYHAGMPADKRNKVQEDFLKDNLQIICATIAFGMGIDKSNVRFVIHYNLPKNIEGYYQEIGRAGRDGLPADTVLFYSYADVATLRSFCETSQQQEIELAKLRRMQDYAEAQICRRKILLNYFSDHLDENCGNCDVCKNPPKHFDGTLLAQKALSAVHRLNEKVGMNMLVDVLRGSSRHELLENKYHEIKTYGAGRDISFANWQLYLMQMLNMGLLEVAFDQNHVLKLTPLSKEVLFGNKQVDLVQLEEIQEKQKAQEREAKPVSKKDQLRSELLVQLKTVRKHVADYSNITPTNVFNDATLTDIAHRIPMTLDELGSVSGVNKKKLSSFGQTFVQAVRNFALSKSEEGIKVDGATHIISFEYWKKGLAPAEIALKRKVQERTIYTHLLAAYKAGEAIKVEDIVSLDELARIENAIAQVGTDSLRELYDHMNEEVAYHKIQFGIAQLEQQ